MRACVGGHEGCVGLLLDRGVNREVQNNNGDTALMMASLFSHEGCVRLIESRRDG